MSDFARALGRTLNRPAWAPVPAWVLSLLLGEMADMLLGGQRAVPAAAEQLGFKFRYRELAPALDSLAL
jgi:NAD dependent epimerase/dehydratase family enzyme